MKIDPSTDDTAPHVTAEAARAPSISASQLFDQKGTSRLAMTTIFCLLGISGAAVAWSSIMPLSNVSTAPGEVVTSEAVIEIQHLEGGIVADILVDEGQSVTKGEALVSLAPEMAETELAQLEARRTAAQLRADLLSATLHGELPDRSEIAASHGEIAVAEFQALAARRENFDSQVAVLQQQIAERRAESATLDSRKVSLRDQIALSREAMDARRTLSQNGHLSRLQLVAAEQEFTRLNGDAATLETETMRLAERIRDAEMRLAELHSTFRADLAEEIRLRTTEAVELGHAIGRARDRVRRLTIAAPAAGRVQDLRLHAAGEVAEPGTTLLRIVPGDAELRVEAQISTADVGHVHVGQDVEVKVQTFDYSRYGTVPGTIRQISATTFIDPAGTPYYEAVIDLDEAAVGGNPDQPLSAGMTVSADIITGRTNLLSYLATPVLKSLDSGLRER